MADRWGWAMSGAWVTDEKFCDWLLGVRYGERQPDGSIKLFVTVGLCLYMHEAWTAALEGVSHGT